MTRNLVHQVPHGQLWAVYFAAKLMARFGQTEYFSELLRRQRFSVDRDYGHKVNLVIWVHFQFNLGVDVPDSKVHFYSLPLVYLLFWCFFVGDAGVAALSADGVVPEVAFPLAAVVFVWSFKVAHHVGFSFGHFLSL
jgi:hypothetical protein